eukprot:c11771_g3_i1 orf=62-451(-)
MEKSLHYAKSSRRWTHLSNRLNTFSCLALTLDAINATFTIHTADIALALYRLLPTTKNLETELSKTALAINHSAGTKPIQWQHISNQKNKGNDTYMSGQSAQWSAYTVVNNVTWDIWHRHTQLSRTIIG